MFTLVYKADFLLLSKNLIRSVNLGAMNALSLSLLDNAFMEYKRSIVGEKISFVPVEVLEIC